MKYTKVIIESEDDLPKEEDFYPVQRKDGIVEWEAWEPSKDKGYVDLWLNTIDWYLIEDTEKSYPEEFVDFCLEAVWLEEREEVDYYYSFWNKGNVIGFDTMEQVYEFWLNEIKDK